jgi:hypothetical protein
MSLAAAGGCGDYSKALAPLPAKNLPNRGKIF